MDRLEHKFEETPSVGVEDPLIERLRSVERLAAHVFVQQSQALLALWEGTSGAGRVGQRPQVLAEAALALGLHELSVGGRLGTALTLAAHPLLTGLLDSGRLGVPHALVAVQEIEALGDPALADRVLTAVLTAGGRLGWDSTPSALRVALRRAAIALDPAGAAARREEHTERRTGVRLRAADNGLADWTATGPAAQLRAGDTLLAQLATPTGPDDDRPAGRRQLDALLDALHARAGGTTSLELQLEIPVRTAVAGVHAPAGAPALPAPVVLRTDLTPDLLRYLTDRTDRTSEQADSIGPDRPHTLRRRRPREGVPELVGLGPVDPALTGELLHPTGLPIGIGQVHIRRLLIDRTGQVTATDATATPLPALLHHARISAGSSGGSSGGSDSKAARISTADLLAQLLTDLPAPPPATAGYTPTAAQRRVVITRNPTCTWPGCHRQASTCDLDHRTRYPDGSTSTPNLHPLCRHHHRLKHDGWTATRHPDGTTTWTSPRHQRRSTPPP